jgi:hypothetical protein
MTMTNPSDDFLKSLYDQVYDTTKEAIAAAVKDSAPMIAEALGAKPVGGFTAPTKPAKPSKTSFKVKSTKVKPVTAKKVAKPKASKQLTMVETNLIAHVKANAGSEGLTIEQIAKGLGLTTKDLKAAKINALAGGSIIVISGEARGTRYGIRGSVKATAEVPEVEDDDLPTGDDTVEGDDDDDIPGTGEGEDIEVAPTRAIELDTEES